MSGYNKNQQRPFPNITFYSKSKVVLILFTASTNKSINLRLCDVFENPLTQFDQNCVWVG